MEGDEQQKAKKKKKDLKKPVKNGTQTTEIKNTAGEHEAENSSQACIGAIFSEIKVIRSDVKTELNNFHETLLTETKTDCIYQP